MRLDVSTSSRGMKSTSGSPAVRVGLVTAFLLPYGLYLAFLVRTGTAPIDYETFMRIGEAFLDGAPVYGENSYYPLPYVMVFAAYRALPRQISLVLWLAIPVAVALVVSRFRPHVLLFAPLFSHFVGGQTAVFGLLGFWGYRNNARADRAVGGLWLALTLLKPQLGVIPSLCALITWGRYARVHRRLPSQALAFLAALTALYLPSLLLDPVWPLEWLTAPRPLFERALSGLIPRSLLTIFGGRGLGFWAGWVLLSLGLLAIVWHYRGRARQLDVLMLWGFVVNPLVHDYDLIQLIPLLATPWMAWAAIGTSLPGWWTIVFAYARDAAWATFTIIAPGLLLAFLIENNPNLRRRAARRFRLLARGMNDP